MAYIELTTGGHNFRLVLSAHGRQTPADVVPSSCRAIFIEGSGFTKSSIFLALKSDSGIYQADGGNMVADPYKYLRRAAQERELVFGLLEPARSTNNPTPRLGDTSFYEMQRRGLKNWLGVQFGRILVSASNDEKVINQNGLVFRLIEEMADQYSEYFPERHIKLRNLMMAQMAMCLAGIDQTEANNKGTFLLNIGLMHLGMVRSLAMSLEERVSLLKNSPTIETLYHKPRIHKGYYVVYDRRHEKWHEHICVDDRLKMR